MNMPLEQKIQEKRRPLRNFRELPIFLYILGMLIVFSFVIPGFFSARNFINISRQIAVVGILSMGMTLAILTAGIDLSEPPYTLPANPLRHRF